MSDSSVEWVEFIEPQTKERMYANLATGACVWEAPPGVHIKKTNEKQWWELFDQNTSRFYYYNALTQKTVWHKPPNCDIIPLAKLQTLKQNTEVQDVEKDSNSTQTPPDGSYKLEHHIQQAIACSTNATQTSPHVSKKHPHSLQISPRTSKKPHWHQHHHHHHHNFQRQTSSTSLPPEQLKYEGNTSPSGMPSRHTANLPQMSMTLMRRQTGQKVGRVLESACPQQSLDLHSGYKTKSQITQSVYYDQDGVMKRGDVESPLGYVKQISACSPSLSKLPSTPRPRPRTNPAYVGVKSSDGGTLYKKLNIEQTQPPTAIYNQRFYETYNRSLDLGNNCQNSEGNFKTYGERRSSDGSDKAQAMYSFKNSHIDFKPINDVPQTCSIKSHGSPVLRYDNDVSETHSSRASLLSQNSLASNYDNEITSIMSQDSLSSMGSRQFSQIEPTNYQLHQSCEHKENTSPHPQAPPRPRHKRNKIGEKDTLSIGATGNTLKSQKAVDNGDYANLPIIGQNQGTLKSKKASPELYANVDIKERMDDWRHSLSPSLDSSNISDGQSSIKSKYAVGTEASVYDVDINSLYSTPSPKNKNKKSPFFQHKKVFQSRHSSLKINSNICHEISTDEKEQESDSIFSKRSSKDEMTISRPVSVFYGGNAHGQVIINPKTGEVILNPIRSTSYGGIDSGDTNNYLQENLNEHKKGLLGKTVSVSDMLMWTKDAIQKPLIRTCDKAIKKEAPEIFKSIQCYMGDRKTKASLSSLGMDITTKGWSTPGIRDEIYIQICKQITENPKEDSLLKGWELVAVCLFFFPPSSNFKSYLEGFITKRLDEESNRQVLSVGNFAAHCKRRLDKVCLTGARKGLRKPTTDEIEHAKKCIFSPSMFGNHLDEVLLMQKDRYPERKLPWIQTTLSEEVLKLNGAQTEGIFRVPGDVDEVNALKVKCDRWIVPTDCPDPHIPVSLLKLWYRELYEPLIPPEFYQECVDNCEDVEIVLNVVNNLPEINRLVLSYLVRFLQVFVAPENVNMTKMDTNNLAMVMAPNCLRCGSDDPMVIFDNTRKEMAFMRTVISNLDTSFMDGVF